MCPNRAQVGLEALAKKAGLDLYSLRYEDASKSRKEWCVAAGTRCVDMRRADG